MRRVIQDFAVILENTLRQNDVKSDWVDSDIDELYSLLIGELIELKDEIEKARKCSHAYPNYDMALEAVDVAAFAMFIWDKSRLLPSSNRGRS